MKYIKLLLIVALAAIVSVSCDKGEAEWTGGGDAEIFFGIKDKPAIKNETRLVETSRVFTQIPITYINEPYSFPFFINALLIPKLNNLVHCGAISNWVILPLSIFIPFSKSVQLRVTSFADLK